jgi:hypothetical protein
MPKCTFVEIPEEEQAQMLAALRRARYGYLLALHILLLCAAKHTPTDIAAVLFCWSCTCTLRIHGMPLSGATIEAPTRR